MEDRQITIKEREKRLSDLLAVARDEAWFCYKCEAVLWSTAELKRSEKLGCSIHKGECGGVVH